MALSRFYLCRYFDDTEAYRTLFTKYFPFKLFAMLRCCAVSADVYCLA